LAPTVCRSATWTKGPDASRADGSGALEPLASFMTNPVGPAIVNAFGPIRQVVQGGADAPRRYLVVALATIMATNQSTSSASSVNADGSMTIHSGKMQPGKPAQVQVE
jgi:hypothetical protein